jgi:hypothetical protein
MFTKDGLVYGFNNKFIENIYGTGTTQVCTTLITYDLNNKDHRVYIYGLFNTIRKNELPPQLLNF